MDQKPDISVMLDKVMSTCAEGITLADITAPDQPLIYVNGGFERMSGYSKSEVLGKNCRFLQGEATDKSQTKRIGHAIRNKTHCTVEFVNYRKNGEPFWNRLTVSPVSLVGDKKQYYVGVQSDITELKNTQIHLKQHAYELDEKNKSIVKALEAFDDELGRAVYQANSKAKQLSENEELNDVMKDALEKIHIATERTQDLVNNLRTMMKKLGGVQHIESLDLVAFTTVNKFEDEL